MTVALRLCTLSLSQLHTAYFFSNFSPLSALFSGFLNSNFEPVRAVANYGLLDIVAALEFIRLTVGAFGGDPANVTVFGHGSGAACINYLMTSASAPLGQSALLTRRLCSAVFPATRTFVSCSFSADSRGRTRISEDVLFPPSASRFHMGIALGLGWEVISYHTAL